MYADGFRFDDPVPPGGYAWWYLDGLSDDGRHGFTVIAFIGSVFSPYYAAARRRSQTADPYEHCAINVALYGEGGHRWAMTERVADQVTTARDRFTVGPSSLSHDADTIVVSVDEMTVPIRRRMRGEIRLSPTVRNDRSFVIDDAGRHRWWPIAPSARVEVDLSHPRQRWSGHAYLDCNVGSEPLEAAFDSWNWSRADAAGDALVYYDVKRRRGEPLELGLRFAADGSCTEVPSPPQTALPTTLWRVPRLARGLDTRAVRNLEDTPFYTRTEVDMDIEGRRLPGVHESLDMQRFSARWVQMLLPFRMPRRYW